MNGLAILALVAGVLALIPVAVIAGFVALSQIKRTGEDGRGLAIAGIVAAAVWTVAAIVLIAVLANSAAKREGNGRIVEAGIIEERSLRRGDCLNDPDESDLAQHAVPCTQEHDGEIFAAFALAGSDYPDAVSMRRRATVGCDHRFERAYAKATRDAVDYVHHFTPNPFQWAGGDRRVLCFAVFAAPRTSATVDRAARGGSCQEIAVGADVGAVLLVVRTTRMSCAEGTRIMNRLAARLGGNYDRARDTQTVGIVGFTCTRRSRDTRAFRVTCRRGERSVTAIVP